MILAVLEQNGRSHRPLLISRPYHATHSPAGCKESCSSASPANDMVGKRVATANPDLQSAWRSWGSIRSWPAGLCDRAGVGSGAMTIKTIVFVKGCI